METPLTEVLRLKWKICRIFCFSIFKIRKYIYIYVSIFMHTCMDTDVPTYTCRYIRTTVHAYIHSYIGIHPHT